MGSGEAEPGVPSRSILVVEDEPEHRQLLAQLFGETGWIVQAAGSGAAALRFVAAEQPAVVLLDLELPDLNGLEVLRLLREIDPEVAIVVFTGDDTNAAVEAMRRGAESFLSKAHALAHVVAAVERAHEKVALRKHARWLWDQQLAERGVARARRRTMHDVVRQIEALSQSDTTVLLLGETGTGKGWVARLLHALSARSRAAFIEVSCAGLTPAFLESELFGHERGAFTGAASHKPGLLETAHGGMVLLDEIGDLAPELQPKLLHALEDRRFRRVGGTRDIELGVRLITATTGDLRAAVRAHRFSEDLFHRIAVAVVRLPPLRQRGRAEIAALATGFLVELVHRFQRGAVTLAPETLDVLARYPWPGNVRELKNVLEQALLVLGAGDVLRPDHMPRQLREPRQSGRSREDRLLRLDEVEQRHVERVLRSTGGNRTEAARLLGISRTGLNKRLQRYGEPAAPDARAGPADGAGAGESSDEEPHRR